MDQSCVYEYGCVGWIPYSYTYSYTRISPIGWTLQREVTGMPAERLRRE